MYNFFKIPIKYAKVENKIQNQKDTDSTEIGYKSGYRYCNRSYISIKYIISVMSRNMLTMETTTTIVGYSIQPEK